MDYEKKYKEAIERLREWDRKHPDGYAISDRDEFIFPELKIDDESIRKALIKRFEEKRQYDHIEGILIKDILAWLEKQGEQKSVKVPKFKIGDFIQFNGMGHTRYTVKEVCGLSHYINTCNKRMDMSYTDANFELVEQKPAEWSDEDESHIRYLIECLEHCKKGVVLTMTTSTAQEYINWLKSLRPQSTWKPSDEHYELEEFAKIVRCNLTGISKAVQKLFEAKYLQLTGNKMYGGFKD